MARAQTLSPLPRSCMSAYSCHVPLLKPPVRQLAGRGLQGGHMAYAPGERRVDSGRCGALRACFCAHPAMGWERPLFVDFHHTDLDLAVGILREFARHRALIELTWPFTLPSPSLFRRRTLTS